MSRSGYSDDFDSWAQLRWRGAVRSAIKGARGQAFLRELRDALDAMPEKALIANELQVSNGSYCTLGVLGQARGIDMSTLDPEDTERVAKSFGIAYAMAAEIVYENDEAGEWKYRYDESEPPEARWKRMRAWVEDNITSGGDA